MSSTQNTYIAVVDDDESIRRALSRWLRAADFQPIAYPSAEAFLADRNHPRFDCLLLDIQLKGMSGIELSQRLSSVKDGTPIIFITAHDEPEVRAQAEACGCAGFFRKSDLDAAVLVAVRRAVGLDDAGPGRKK